MPDASALMRASDVLHALKKLNENWNNDVTHCHLIVKDIPIVKFEQCDKCDKQRKSDLDRQIQLKMNTTQLSSS